MHGRPGQPGRRPACAVEEAEAEGFDRTEQHAGELEAVAPQAEGQRGGPADRGSGLRTERTRSSPRGPTRSISSRQAAPAPGHAASSEATVGSRSWCNAISVPSAKGWAMIACGQTHSTPSRSSSSSCMTGEAAVMGTNPAQWSWTKPGSVSSEENVAPPGWGPCSSTVTRSPAAATRPAAISPLCPAPMTRTCIVRTCTPAHVAESKRDRRREVGTQGTDVGQRAGVRRAASSGLGGPGRPRTPTASGSSAHERSATSRAAGRSLVRPFTTPRASARSR